MYKNLVSRSFLIISTYCLLLLLFFLFLQNNEIVQSVQFPDSNIPKDLSKFKFYSVAENNTNNSSKALDQYQIAIDLYNKSLEIDPNNVDTIFNKGRTLILMQEYVEANKLFDKALTMNPDHVASLFYKGIVLDKLGKDEKAIKFYKMAKQIDPDYTGQLINTIDSFREDFKVDTSSIRTALNITQQYNIK